MNRPLIAITAGDPAGIGPEIIAALWAQAGFHQQCRAVVCGLPAVIQRACDLVATTARIVEVSSPSECESSESCLPVIACGSADAVDLVPGVMDARGGQAAYEALAVATKLALSDRVDAITTAPLNKAALALAGHDYPGHTELLADLCGVDEFAMMLYLPPHPSPDSDLGGSVGLGVVHATLHIPLSQVVDRLSTAGILSKIQLAHEVFEGLLASQADEAGTSELPRLAVCALNPHAGEEGLFGDEETRIIRPAVEAARRRGLDVQGPLPADTLLARAADGEFDAVIAMYHDQGHVALKMLGMRRAVNVTLGLPIIRTSVAHGTAFDRAWEGTSDPGSLGQAVAMACILSRQRKVAGTLRVPSAK